MSSLMSTLERRDNYAGDAVRQRKDERECSEGGGGEVAEGCGLAGVHSQFALSNLLSVAFN